MFFSKLRNNHALIFRLTLFILTSVIIVLMLPKKGTFKYEFKKGNPWLHETLISSYDFPILKSNEDLLKEKNEIINNQKITLVFDNSLFSKKAEIFIKEFEDKWSNNNKIKKDKKFTFFNLFNSKSKIYNSNKSSLAKYGLNFLEDLYSQGIIKIVDEIELNPNINQFYLKQNNIAKYVDLNDFYTIESAKNKINSIDKLSDDEALFLIPLLLDAIDYNVFYDPVLTKKMLNQELKNLSIARGKIKKGQVIISQGELVTDSKFQALLSYKSIYEGTSWNEKNQNWILLGQTILILIILMIFYLFLKRIRPLILLDINKLIFLLLMIVLMVSLAILTVSISVKFVYIIPFCLIPIILKAFFDTRIALFTHTITIIIIGFFIPNSFEFIYLQFMAGTITLFSVLNMYKRSQLFLTSFKIILIYFICYFAISLTQEVDINNIKWINFIWFASNGVLTLLAYPLIFIFEKVFSLTSDLSLLELSDTNSPLLRKLAQSAPGTFQHSIQVANLAEEGILEIGGNPLLVRAGALYHDIGKMKNPQFFIENQNHNINPHDDLSSHESAEVIINHVKNGIIIAKKHNLPDELIDFIRTHHGTSTVQYFYNQHVDDYKEELIIEDKFKYTGPKPFSKETAVLMMADSVEAASRSFKNISFEDINLLVENIIDNQIDNDQFVNSDITLKAISQIKKLFKKKLQSIYHVRLEY
tara:strand:+ start:708 stop:2810 length:2103 start_codon:yes stop_codon:yes gene_type:complete